MSDLKRTQLYNVHIQAGASMVDFGGWEMPIQYPTCTPATHAASSTCPTWVGCWWRARTG